jgi:hypothetical protein
MKARIIIALVFLISETLLSAQDKAESPLDRPRNNVYFNFIGGDGSVISTNYERLFLIRSKSFLEGGLGIGYNKIDDISDSNGNPDLQFKYYTIPHHISMNLGKSKSFFEIGLGGTGIIGDVNQNYYLYPFIGYRFQSLESNKLIFRVYAGYPFYGWENMNIWWLPVGVSLGMCL